MCFHGAFMTISWKKTRLLLYPFDHTFMDRCIEVSCKSNESPMEVPYNISW